MPLSNRCLKFVRFYRVRDESVGNCVCEKKVKIKQSIDYNNVSFIYIIYLYIVVLLILEELTVVGLQ